MKYTINDREVEITESDFDGNVALVIDAYYVDTDEQLSEKELRELENRYEYELAQEAYSHMLDHAYERIEAVWENL